MKIESSKSIGTLIQSIAVTLNAKYNNKELSTQYAWWMVQEITQQTKATLIANRIIDLCHTQQTRLSNWIQQQVTYNVPLQYLMGSVPFGDCTILVEPPILIPRQETEQWSMILIERLKKFSDHPLRILDMCTGSGCIAIALAQALPKATIYAVDTSKVALALAQKNALHNRVSNIKFICSDLFKALSAGSFDLIVANPPYVAADEWQHLDPSVRIWEDKNALLAADNGTALAKQIIHQARYFLSPHSLLIANTIPRLIIEIGYQQGTLIQAEFYKAGFCHVVIEKDLEGNDRTVAGYSTNEAQSDT